MLVNLVNGRIEVYAEFRQKELVKKVPGSRWDNHAGVWYLPLSWAACVQLRAVFGQDLQVGQELATWVQAERAQRLDPCMAWRKAEDADLPMFGSLYPFQRAGVAFMATAGSALNADEMGLGKSVQAIATLELLNAYPALIVCPNSMKHSWAAEFEKWAPGRIVSIISGTPAKRKKAIDALAAGEAHVGVINYEALRSHTRLSGYGNMELSEKEKEDKELNAIQFGAVVADEAHRVKDPHSKQTRALWYVGDRAHHRFALTGTPVANSPEDIWCLMRFVSPNEYPYKSQFIERYALQTYNVFGFMQVAGIKSEHAEELFRILDPRFIRRVKSVVLPQLPEKVYTTRYVKMETAGGSKTKQGTAYETMRKEMLAALDSGTLLAANPLTQAIRLCQFASAYGELEPTGELDEQGNAKTRLVLTDPSCKADALEEILLETGDSPVVVFAESKQLINLCNTRLVKAAGAKDNPMFGWRVGLVTGDVPDYERAENVRLFQDGQLKVLLLTLGAGGEGLTLTAASTAIFLQRSWSAVQNAQAEDRIHRIGQTATSVNIIDVITEGTIEDRVRAVLAEKAGMLEEITRDGQTMKEWLAK
jgi:ATP-dependent helicase STH1/SNF2